MSEQLLDPVNRHSLIISMANIFESFLKHYLERRDRDTIQNSNSSFTKKTLMST